MALIRVNCPHRQQHQGGSKDGKAPTGIQRFLCNFCHHSFHLEEFKIKVFFTDDWGACERLLPESKHIIGKANTQGIEREHFQRF